MYSRTHYLYSVSNDRYTIGLRKARTLEPCVLTSLVLIPADQIDRGFFANYVEDWEG